MNQRSVVQLGDVDDDGTVGEVENRVRVDGQVVGGDDEPVVGGLESVELRKLLCPMPFNLEGAWERLDAVRQRIAPQPGLHAQRVGVLLTRADRHGRPSRVLDCRVRRDGVYGIVP